MPDEISAVQFNIENLSNLTSGVRVLTELTCSLSECVEKLAVRVKRLEGSKDGDSDG